MLPLLHAGAPHEQLTRHSTRCSCIGHQGSALKFFVAIKWCSTHSVPLCFTKTQSYCKLRFAQCKRRVHPSDPASSSTTRHLGYFSNHLPALEKATSCSCSHPAIVLAAPLITKTQVNKTQRHLLDQWTCCMVCVEAASSIIASPSRVSVSKTQSHRSPRRPGGFPPANPVFLRTTSTCCSSPSQEGPTSVHPRTPPSCGIGGPRACPSHTQTFLEACGIIFLNLS